MINVFIQIKSMMNFSNFTQFLVSFLKIAKFALSNIHFYNKKIISQPFPILSSTTVISFNLS